MWGSGLGYALKVDAIRGFPQQLHDLSNSLINHNSGTHY